MKKILIFLIILVMITGCQSRKSEETIDEQLYQQYQTYNKKVKNHQQFNSEIEEEIFVSY